MNDLSVSLASSVLLTDLDFPHLGPDLAPIDLSDTGSNPYSLWVKFTPVQRKMISARPIHRFRPQYRA